VLAMLEGHAHPGPGSAVGTELVGDHHARHAGWLSYQFAQELLHCALLRCELLRCELLRCAPILDRIRAVDDFLFRYPEWKGKLVLIQVAAPTRSKLDAYSTLQDDTQRLADEINARHGTPDCAPIRLVIRHHEPAEVLELFRAADICIVSSLHDGMNLVAKEFVAARDDGQGVLVLSSFAGASRELAEALIINPYDTHGTAEVLARALQMTADEQRERMTLMRNQVRQRNVYRWAAQMLLDAAQLRRRQRITTD